jgi:pyruvate dehydrogenase E2 component (dihydrolipoamide acetyltransferase)
MSIEFKLPELGHDLETGDVVSVLVREGDVIAENDSVVEVETEKAVVEINCPHAGKIVKVHMTKGQTVRVGQPVVSIETESDAPEKAVPEGKKPDASAAATQPEESPQPSSLTEEEGTQQAEQTEEMVPSAGIPAQRGTREPAVPPGELDQDAFGPIRREPMSKVRQTMAAHLVKSVSTIPHVTSFDDADVTELDRMRKTIPPAYLGPTVKLTALPFAMKAVALALRQHPVLNSTLVEKKHEIVYKQYINIGVAVETPRGFLVPVIRNVDQMGVLQIARELTLLAARARSGDFKPEELQGGTFTINNIGAVGGVYGTPIINHPEVAVLLLGRSRWLLGVHEGKIEGRLMMPLSLSYDPRVVDGAAAGRFLNDVMDFVQSPGKLLLTR